MKTKSLYSNKWIVAITPTEVFYNLLASTKESPGKTLEFTLQDTGYYLIDNPGDWTPDEEFKRVFTPAFESELWDCAVPGEA